MEDKPISFYSKLIRNPIKKCFADTILNNGIN